MIVVRTFSKKLSWLDDQNLKEVQRWKDKDGSLWFNNNPHGTWKGYKARMQGDYDTAYEETKKHATKEHKAVAKVGAGLSVVGAGLGAYAAKKGHKGKVALIGAAIPATITGTTILGDKLGNKLGDKLIRKTDKLVGKETHQKRLDEIKVVEGKMSKKEFIKKYGK